MTEYGRGAKAGIIAGVVWGVISGVISYALLQTYKSTVLPIIEKTIPNNSTIPLTAEQIFNIAVYGALFSAIIVGVIGGVILGLIFAAVKDAFLKKSSLIVRGVVFGIVLWLINMGVSLGSASTYGSGYFALTAGGSLIASLIFGYLLGSLEILCVLLVHRENQIRTVVESQLGLDLQSLLNAPVVFLGGESAPSKHFDAVSVQRRSHIVLSRQRVASRPRDLRASCFESLDKNSSLLGHMEASCNPETRKRLLLRVERPKIHQNGHPRLGPFDLHPAGLCQRLVLDLAQNKITYDGSTERVLSDLRIVKCKVVTRES